MLEPCSLEFGLQMRSRASRAHAEPRYTVRGVLDFIKFGLTRMQYVSALELLDVFTNFSKQVAFASSFMHGFGFRNYSSRHTQDASSCKFMFQGD